MKRQINRRLFAGLAGGAALAGHRMFAQTTGSGEETGATLPAADLPSMNPQGHQFELASTFEGNFNNVPDEAPVYQMDLLSYTTEQVQDFLDRFGINDEANDLGGGTYSAQSRGAQLYVTQGRVQYMSLAKLEDGDLPDDGTAIASARDWLREHAMLPADVGDGSILERQAQPPRVVVGFMPVQPSPIISAIPSVIAVIGPNSTVTEAANSWAKITRHQIFKLRGTDYAWQEVRDKRAWIDASLPTDVYPAGAAIGGSVIYRRVSLAYTTSGIPGEIQYLQPVYVFEGEMTPDGTEDTYPAKAYVAALINSNQPVG